MGEWRGQQRCGALAMPTTYGVSDVVCGPLVKFGFFFCHVYTDKKMIHTLFLSDAAPQVRRGRVAPVAVPLSYTGPHLLTPGVFLGQ